MPRERCEGHRLPSEQSCLSRDRVSWFFVYRRETPDTATVACGPMFIEVCNGPFSGRVGMTVYGVGMLISHCCPVSGTWLYYRTLCNVESGSLLPVLRSFRSRLSGI